MDRPLIRASMVTLLFVLLLSIALPTFVVVPPSSAAPLNEIPPPPTDAELLSEGKPAAADYYCSYNGCKYPEYANDGDVSTWWSTYIPPPGESTDEVPWTVDLGATYELTRIDAIWASNCCYHPDRYRVAVSDDNSTFTTVLTRTAVTETETSDVLQARGRYVRVLLSNDMTTWRYAHEIKIYGHETGPLDLTVTDSAGQPVDALALNSDGWPATNAATGAIANPITVTMTISNTTDAPVTYNPQLTLGEADGLARFYVFDQPGAPVCLPIEDVFSLRLFEDSCTVTLNPGRTRTLTWRIWIQPSDTATLHATAELREGITPIATRTQTMNIPQAAVHPVVFIHGILGSMPPTNQLLTNRDTMEARLDPFLGSYWPLLHNLEKLGYEWNTSLFALAYDWRNPNDVSASFLASQLQTAVIPRSRPTVVPYTSSTAKADLVVHSMGGLVSRSYIQGSTYQGNVRKLVFLASPHKGFPYDYQTWEGLTWRDYLYNAPLASGNVLGLTGVLMDGDMWPVLIEKKYAPTDTEIADQCVPYGEEVGKLIVVDSQGNLYRCNWNTLARWSHAIDPLDTSAGANRGIRSLYEMLPTDDLATPAGLLDTYLTNADGTVSEPFGRQSNTFLTDLNANINLLSQRLGVTNIYNIYGFNAPTDVQYQMAIRGVDMDVPDMWRYGRARGIGVVEERDVGDDLIPTDSATLLANGLLATLPNDNERGIDDELSQERGLGLARHKELVFHPEVQQQFIPRFLGVVSQETEVPFASPYQSPLAIGGDGGNIGKVWAVITSCPINLLITDPQGRRLGYDAATDTVLREIPGAIYTSPHHEPQFVLIPEPVEGDYTITSIGYDTGAYSITIAEATAAGSQTIAVFSGLTTDGQTDAFTVSPPDRPPFPTTGIVDPFDQGDGPLAPTWVGATTSYTVTNQQLVVNADGPIYQDTLFGADQEVYITLDSINPAADEIDLLLKGQGTGACDVLEVWYQPTRGTAQVWTCQGTGVWVQHGPDIPMMLAVGDQFGARATADGVVEIYRNGLLIDRVIIDASWPYRGSGGRIGLWTIRAAGTTLDDFGGGTLIP